MSAMSTATNLGAAFSNTAGRAQETEGQTISTFFASLATAVILFGVQFGVFIIIKNRFTRIYQPRTFLVPEKERTKSPPTGIWQWIVPVFRTSNSDFIQKCGLDAYFFLRYLRTLLKIFIPLAFVILPILLPLNAVHGRGPHFATGLFSRSDTWSNVTGLDTLAWGNVSPRKNNRYWGHLILALCVVAYTCWVFYDELRGYIRLRQAYLTSPQHRLRASATTVLVTAIPRKWCTVEALDGLYDVFPGGIRNIWINRNYDELNDKVQKRNKWALALESAETALIKNSKKAQIKKLKQEAKKAGKNQTKEHQETQKKIEHDRAEAMAGESGLSMGNPHQVRHTIDDALNDTSGKPSREQSPERDNKKPFIQLPIVGQGIENIGQGISNIGKSVFGGLRRVGNEADGRLNTTGGLVLSDPQYPSSGQQGLDGTIDVTAHDPILRSTSTESTINQRSSQEDRACTPAQGTKEPSNERLAKSTLDPRMTHDLKSGIPRHSQEPNIAVSKQPKMHMKFWKESKQGPYDIPSPTPHGLEDDEFPLGTPSPITPGGNLQATVNGFGSETAKDTGDSGKKSKWSLPFLSKSNKEPDHKLVVEYPAAYEEDLDVDNEGEPTWKMYLKPGDRDTMRLPIFGWSWMISLPLVGKKVDTIYYCRKEVARLNLEIEQDQREPEKYPLMNSAFVQFNHQVAAHMACQSVSHHVPNQMAPRLVEISPDDVIWDNMSITWWERYLRTAIVLTLIAALIIGWAFPVTFTGLLSQVNYLRKNYKWLAWLGKLPAWTISIIQGILPQLFLAILLLLLPIILRILAKNQGVQTGMAVELAVQDYYFFFLFIQVFLVVSISSAITTVVTEITTNPQSIPSILASNLPKASNYFFSYLLLQALSTSAGALVQVMSLISWFILAPLTDNTARQKWARQINLPTMNWGTFFPVYTNLAAIGLIYSVIAPLILVFNIVTFGLFWVVYRYNTLYVTKFRFDTGGLLFPKAINQLFTGLYVMELCLIGLFFLVRDVNETTGNAEGSPCKGQAIVMIVVLILTAGYQWLLNDAFSPLFRYLPITLEDDAVIRDEAFARAQDKKWNLTEGEQDGDDINDVLEAKERRSEEQDVRMEDIELREVENHKQRNKLDPRNLGAIVPGSITNVMPKRSTWADRSRKRGTDSWANESNVNRSSRNLPVHHHPTRPHTDIESQMSPGNAIGEALFSGLNDEIEDLTPEERDKLVQRAFQHEALRAKRPVIWIPRDDLGVSDDEIYRTQRLSKHIWISNEYTALDGKARVVYRRSPPDFSEVDLIDL